MIKSNKISTIQQAIKSYRSGPPPPTGGEWVTSPNREEIRAFLGRSFAGTDTVAGEPVIGWTLNHVGDWCSPEEYVKTFTFILGYPMFDAAVRGSPLIVAKTLNGKMTTAAIVCEYEKKRRKRFGAQVAECWRTIKSFCKLMWTDRIPDLFNDDRHKAEN